MDNHPSSITPVDVRPRRAGHRGGEQRTRRMTDWFPFIGENELTIDEKNRLLVPSDIRRKLDPERDGEALIMVIGPNGRPWLYPEKFYQKMVSDKAADMAPDEDTHAFDLMYFARASRLAWDKQGRVVLPEKALRRTGLNKDVALLGVKDHLELANQVEWDEEDVELGRKSKELFGAKRARQAEAQRTGDGGNVVV